MNLGTFISLAFEEDIGAGDFTTQACIDESRNGTANLLIKSAGMIAGVDLAEKFFFHASPSILFRALKKDGDRVSKGEIAFTVSGSVSTILRCERLVLNCMQRMSGIATLTALYVKHLEGLNTKVLDTRKTTPLFRDMEKWAVRIGGGFNHRMGLYDMILIKDNHVDAAGGIRQAIWKTKKFMEEKKLDLRVEIETRNLGEVEQVIQTGYVNRIMLDNFSIDELEKAVYVINGKFETEASGGITLATVRAIAETGVDFVSVGEITHSVKSMDMSLKIVS